MEQTAVEKILDDDSINIDFETGILQFYIISIYRIDR